MIIIKPTVGNISAFDATLEQTISFVWSGNQAVSNTCIIKNNSTNSIIYQATETTMQLKHIIPANTLTNGTLYNLTIAVTDNNGTVSDTSNAVLFYCYTTPIFQFSNLTENQVIQNSSFDVTLSYSQNEGEKLQYYQISLYDTSESQIWTTGITYDTDTLSITLTSLEDNGNYKIRAIGYTINGMFLDTGYIDFSINYIQPNVYALITLENKKDEGSVKIQSNIIALSGTYYNGTPTYINNDYIDLTSPNNYVYFDEGFSLNKDFTLNIKGYGFIDNSVILSMTDGNFTITLMKHKGTFESENNVRKIYYELKVPNELNSYVIQSNYLSITDTESTDIFSIWIRRVGSVYNLYVENLTTA